MPTYTTSPTETLRPGDVVVLRGKEYHVTQCCCDNFSLVDSDERASSRDFACKKLDRITELIRKEFAKIAPKESPKEVPPLAVGQKWRTRGGKEVTICRSDSTIWPFSATDIVWWYKSHEKSKYAHSPGNWRNDNHDDTLVEIIADAPAAEKASAKDEVTLVLSRDEAQAVYEVIGGFVIGNGPARKKTSSVFWKLSCIGFNSITGYPLKVCPEGVLCVEVKEPLFRLNEVWRTEKKYLARVDGTAEVRTIHNPKEAMVNFGQKDTRKVSADGSIDGWNDKLIEKISD